MGVYKRNGKWEIRLQMNGVPYYRQVPEAQNKPQAKLAEAALRQEIFSGKYGREVGETDFVKFCQEVYLPQARSAVKSHKNVTYKVGTLCAYFRGKRLRDITQIAVEGYKRKRLTGDSQLGRPRKAVTVKQEINTLSAILNLAIANELLGTNPCRRVKFPKGSLESRRERVLSEDEEDRLMERLQSHAEVRAAVVIALNTGLRRMEILTRRREDFDAQGHTLAVVRKGGKRQTVPLNTAAFEAVRELCSNALPDGRLFRIGGHALSSLDGVFKNSLRSAGVENFTFHDLRHTFASRMIERGVDPFTLRTLMGHTALHMTAHYVTSDPKGQREAVGRLDGGRNVTEFHHSFTKRAAKARNTA